MNVNNLPDDNRLRQDWLPTEPVTIKSLLMDVIKRTSAPTVIGSTNRDWYYEMYPDESDVGIKDFKCDITCCSADSDPILAP